jgi:hypothetical protein
VLASLLGVKLGCTLGTTNGSLVGIKLVGGIKLGNKVGSTEVCRGEVDSALLACCIPAAVIS